MVKQSQQDNTYIMDPDSAAEMTRLILQDRLMTRGMGGPFPEYGGSLPAGITHILDVGCGPGGWVLDVAYSYPRTEVIGIDVSGLMIEYAMTRAVTERRHNTTFLQGSILHPLDFPDASFDLINVRLMVAALKREAWPTTIRELARITRPGGIIRLTECDTVGNTTSPAAQQIVNWSYQALHKMGYGFSPDGKDLGITPHLGELLEAAGCEDVQTKAHALDFSFGTDLHIPQYKNYMVVFQLFAPMIAQLGLATQEEFALVYQQMLTEMNQEDFRALWYLLTCWGKKR